jgi:hypothetical protein
MPQKFDWEKFIEELRQRYFGKEIGARNAPVLKPGRSPRGWQQPLTLEQQWIQNQRTAPAQSWQPAYPGGTPQAGYPMPSQYVSTGFAYQPQPVRQAQQTQLPGQLGPGWNRDDLRGPFANRYYDPNYNNDLAVYQNPDNPWEFAGWRWDPKEVGGYKFSNTGTERNAYGQPAGTIAPYGQTGGAHHGLGHVTAVGTMVNGEFVETGLPAGETQTNPNRSVRTFMRNSRRKKAKERRSAYEEQSNGYGVQSAASGTATSWRM